MGVFEGRYFIEEGGAVEVDVCRAASEEDVVEANVGWDATEEGGYTTVGDVVKRLLWTWVL